MPQAEAQWKTLAAQNPGDGRTQVLLGSFYSRAGRVTEAEKVLAALVAAQPKAEEYRMQLAGFYAAHAKADRMTATLEQAIRDLPAEYPAYEALARHLVGQGRGGEAARWLEKALETVDTPAEAEAGRVFLARVRQSEGRLDDALELVGKVLGDAPGNAEARVLKGDLLVARQDYVGAVPEYRVALKEDPRDAQTMGSLARAHVLNEQPVLAEDVFKAALGKNPKLREARLGLAALYAQQKRFGEARAELQKVLEGAPDDRVARAALGDLALASKDPAAASVEYRKLREMDPRSPPALYRSGMASRAAGRREEAEGLLEGALRADPDFEPALVQLVQLKAERRDLAGAIELCRRQVAARPDNSRFRALLGQVQARSKDFAAARATFEEALSRDPNSLESVSGLAGLERSLGTLDAAASRYRERARKDPKDAAAALALGVVLEVKGDLPGARAAYEAALAARPDAVIAANNLANYLVESDPSAENLKRAEKLVMPLLPKYGRNPILADTAAWLCCRRGDYVRGRDLLLGASRAGPLSPVSNYHLGVIYQKLGDKAKAKERLQLALQSKERFSGRAEAEKLVRQL
jgi:tetratricopeptide (TPR) repeat protein